jgi:N-acetylated-alpha-linked acidic dipeptidase
MPARHSLSRSTLLLLALQASLATGADSPEPGATSQSALESRLDAAIHPEELGAWLKLMSAEPNHVGSPHDRANAEYQLGLFRSWGWDAHIETFEVLYPTPLSETLELVAPTHFRATLQEPPVSGDASSARTAHALPAYVVFQGDGDVSAPLVYVNYGMPDDYKALELLNISVRGKIVIARYGSGWRGLKPKLAQDHGAIGCIIYSDPADDGYALDDAYPKGPMRPAAGLQRGSVADMPLYPGDPLTPGIGATRDARRLARADATTLLKIPVLPISHADAQHFLAALGGAAVPPGWRGALPITYHVGSGTHSAGEPIVHLAVKSDWSLKTVYDVIAVIPGAVYPDQWVIRGNHHDGWVFGASDPLSGQVALMAEAKAIGGLLQTGWRPKRTLVYASWDAEEPMLLGSTEWVETHADELQRKAVLYVNSDGNGRGLLSAAGSHDYQHLVSQVAADVSDPETGVSVGARLRAAIRVAAFAPGASAHLAEEARRAEQPDQDIPIEALGSGSDFSPFLQHLGIATLDLGYQGEGNPDGVYHSIYDSFEHHARFVDPGFVYDALLARTVGRVVLRVAESDLPVQRATGFADTVAGYLGELHKLADSRREAVEAQAALLRDHSFELAADPTKPHGPPTALAQVPYLNLAPLDNAIERLGRAAHAYDAALAAHGAALSLGKREQLQLLMRSLAQTLTADVGLPGRPWYRNLVYAPGRLTGYGAKTLPGVREAIEDERWADADRYATLTGDALNAYSLRLEQAVIVLGGEEKPGVGG